MFFYSEFQQSYYWLPLVGFTIGLVASMIGSGGGFFFPLILILFFSIQPQVAVATSLAASLPLCISGTVGHYRKKNIRLWLGVVFAAAGILGAITGVAVTHLLTPGQLKTFFGIYSVILAILIVMNTLRVQPKQQPEKKKRHLFTTRTLTTGGGFGFIGGMISGTFGSSGAAPVIAGLVALNTPLRMVAGTSLIVVLVNTVSALAGHFVLGQIDLTLVYLLTAGSVLGAATGPHLMAKVNLQKADKPVRLAIALVVIVSGIVLIIN